ncbi:hypothetical protein [Leifsonia sp. Leaf264]|uniref:hypothetical protein n=1 Tax=Leifsonia sp. Leaf264 TaxID=1736314 RepID=UPI0007020B8C|nr:hypothetical protein [Leifsonia sp. Leaf264]KQP01414.1 hypothetical protein ASF30_02010 [Leifsonia sp. Leaf264]
MRTHILIKLGVAAAIVMASLGATAGTAQAAEMPAGVAVSQVAVTGIDDDGTDLPRAETVGPRSDLIPINRWYAADRLIHKPGSVDPAVAAAGAVAGIDGLTLRGANALWIMTTVFVVGAAGQGFLDSVLAIADQFAGAIGEVLSANLVWAVAAGVAMVGAVLWAGLRNRSTRHLWRRMATATLLLAFLFVTTNAATLTTGGSNGEPLKPGTGSPAWIVKGVSNFSGNILNGAISGITNLTIGDNAGKGPAGEMSCDRYIQNLDDYTTAGARVDATPVRTISNLFMRSWGWAIAQTGDGAVGVKYVACHVADWQADTPAKSQILMSTVGVAGGDKLRAAADPESPAFAPKNDRESTKAAAGWAACTWTGDAWAVRPGWEFVDPAVCTKWWSGGKDANLDMGVGSTSGLNLSAREQGAPPKTISQLTDDEDVINFVRTQLGVTGGTPSALPAIAGLIAALTVFVVFGLGLSLLILGASALAGVAVAISPFLLVAAVFAPAGPGRHIKRLSAQAFGAVILANSAKLVLWAVTLSTQLIQSLGAGFGGSGSLGGAIFAAITPILAIVLLQQLWKRFAGGKANPFTVGGAMKLAKGFGGDLGANAASRIAGAARGYGKAGARAGGRALLRKATGGALGNGPTGTGRTGAPAQARRGEGSIPRNEPRQQTKKEEAEHLASGRALLKTAGAVLGENVTVGQKAAAAMKSATVKVAAKTAAAASSAARFATDPAARSQARERASERLRNLSPATRAAVATSVKAVNRGLDRLDEGREHERQVVGTALREQAKRLGTHVTEHPFQTAWSVTKTAATATAIIGTAGLATPIVLAPTVGRTVVAAKKKAAAMTAARVANRVAGEQALIQRASEAYAPDRGPIPATPPRPVPMPARPAERRRVPSKPRPTTTPRPTPQPRPTTQPKPAPKPPAS